MIKSLTHDQVSRQDFVDSTVHQLLETLAGRELEHDISLIAKVREAIAEEFAERSIMAEMEFYPFISLIRPVTENLMQAIMMDSFDTLHPATIVDFGLDTQRHFEALYYPVRAGEITADQLDLALGDGEKLTALARSARNNHHKDIVFDC